MYKVTDQDRTPEGLKNLLKNYIPMATFMGGLVPGRNSNGEVMKTFKVENYLVEGIDSVENMELLLNSDVFGSPYGVYLEAKEEKKLKPAMFNIFDENEQAQFKAANLPAEAIDLMKSACFDILDQYGQTSGSEETKPELTGNAEAVINQEEYQKYYKQYDEFARKDIIELVKSEDFANLLKRPAMFTSKGDLIRFYIEHKHGVKPEFSGN